MSSRHHIPFPRAFLSLNTPLKQATNATVNAPSAELASHGFLSNRPVVVSRHSSVSSVSSVDSTASTASASTVTELAIGPVLQRAATSFLSLNTKYAAPPASAKALSGEKHTFLSNRH